ncbi:MAG: hypothetical protein WCE48_02145 [Steroidobacteraceae bacterium]
MGTYRGHAGTYATIQAAVDDAAPGDWILIAPGDYKEQSTVAEAGVFVAKPGIHLRGMDRNRVVIDGTLPGFDTCSADPAAQRLGSGRNGILVSAVDGVSIENLSVCNFLNGTKGGGNQVWWNGGDGSGVIGMGSYHGAYLTASATYYSDANNASYGIFASNARGPGLIEWSYASNMSDSDFYVGACPDCNATLRGVHAQNSPQGFSGTNAGGHLVLELSEWDHNRVGIASTTLANDDRPSPQDGACPGEPGRSCTLIQFNYVHDNNVADTPGEGIAATVPVGTGIIISGGRNDTVRRNLIAGNGAWGVLLNDYPDGSLGACDGGNAFFNPPPPFDQILGPVIPCYFHAFGNTVTGNFFLRNGAFGNDTNGDLANAALDYPVRNCFRGNFNLKSGAVSSSPADIQDPSVLGSCSGPWAGDPTQQVSIFLELLCDAFGPASGACASPNRYPTQTVVKLLPIPGERGMPDPCQGVPPNSWCSARRD